VVERAAPKVSVIVVNYRGAEHTVTCLRALRDELDWPAETLELICVDNASGDGSPQRIAAAVPQARLIRPAPNTGFAGGCNLGVTKATGPTIGFLNSDPRPHRDCVRAAADAPGGDRDLASLARKAPDRDGERIAHVHVSENDRGVPGTGSVAWDAAFGALGDVGYDGWLTVEAFGNFLPNLAAATKIWRPLFDSEEQLAKDAYGFLTEKTGPR